MLKSMTKFFITTPIYYVNDVPHIGSAYTTLAADVLARAHRQYGDEVRFITGTDEHGAKIAQAAKEAGLAPLAFADSIAGQFQKTWALLDIKADEFGRTTDDRHRYLVGRVIEYLYRQELVYPGKYEGWYCLACEEYKELRPGSGTQQDPVCEVHNRPLEFISESIYYFALSRFQEELVGLIEGDQLLIRPESRKNEVLSFLHSEPLRDIPVTRSKVSWGVPVPFAPEQTVYVWFDALLNYLSFSGAKIGSSANKTDQTEWLAIYLALRAGIWPPSLQLIGKDILRFHAVIWPAMLLALKLPLPKELFVHGFFTVNGQKMSKSLGNVIRPQELVLRYGVSATRYLILSAFPFGADGDISIQKFDTAYTAYLANGLGNLLQRTIVLINKFGIKPWIRLRSPQANSPVNIKEAYLANDLTRAIELTFQLVAEADRYLASKQPWAMDNDALRETVLVKTYEELQKIAEALVPLMPETAEAIKRQLETLEPEPLFPRLENK